MPAGLNPSYVLVERFVSGATAAQTMAQKFIAPIDLEVEGMTLWCQTAPGSGNGVTVNLSNSPTSQIGGTTQLSPNPYNLWTATNVPTILGTAQTNLTVSQSTTFYGAQSLILNQPYALNYPLPGPSGTTGFTTAQSTSQTTQTPVTSPPVVAKPSVTGFVAPDNTYTDFNGITGTSASIIHAGDVLSFVIGYAGANNSVGSTASLDMVLYCLKR